MGIGTVQYACCNEDSRSELAALNVRDRRVVSIAAAGERAFALLLGDPREVVAIDRNPAQIYLTELKVAAMRQLEREAYLGFLGIRHDADREATYRTFAHRLPAPARRYWDRHLREVREGIHATGLTERGLSRVAPMLRMLLADTVVRLRAAESIEAQGQLAGELLRRPGVHALLGLIFNPVSGRFFLRDRVYYGDARRDAAPYIIERLVTTLENHRFDDCFIFELFLQGHLRYCRALPLDCTEDAYPIVRARLDRLRLAVGDIRSYLAAQPSGSVDAFSLSDLGGYLTVDEYSELLDQVERVASEDARLCIREFISQPTRLSSWPKTLLRDRALEQHLDRSDRSVGCTFVCAAKIAEVGA